MLQALKLTFGSVWGWLGIIVGVMYFDVGIGVEVRVGRSLKDVF